MFFLKAKGSGPKGQIYPLSKYILWEFLVVRWGYIQGRGGDTHTSIPHLRSCSRTAFAQIDAMERGGAHGNRGDNHSMPQTQGPPAPPPTAQPRTDAEEALAASADKKAGAWDADPFDADEADAASVAVAQRPRSWVHPLPSP